MKIIGKSNNASQSCSCTSCVYNSGSDDTSLHKLLLSGSRVDRLYYGKYIPLRERKLLDKLVRTRAVYDDIRAQLVSESASSLHKNANFKRKPSASEVDDTEKSSAILELVNLVDKGAALKSSKLSECCSCCSCSSKLHSGENSHTVHKHRHAHGSKHAAEQRRHEFKKKKGVRFKAKHIKSDPCTCTFQFSGLEQKKHTVNANNEVKIKDKFKESATNLKSKMIIGVQKVHDSKTKLQEAIAVRTQESIEKIKRVKDQVKSKKKSPDIATNDREMWIAEDKTKTQRVKDLATESLEKLKNSQTRLKNKLQEGSEKIELKVKKSLEKIKKGKNKLKSRICMCSESGEKIVPDEQVIALKIRKDSIRKFKENLRRKENLKDWTCEDDCIEGTCVPVQCYEKLKVRKANKQKILNKREMGSSTELSGRQINVSVSPKKSNADMQPHQTNLEIISRSGKHRKVKKGIKLTKEKGTNKHKSRPTSSSYSSDAGIQDHETNLQIGTKTKENLQVKKGAEVRKEKSTKKNKSRPNSSSLSSDTGMQDQETNLRTNAKVMKDKTKTSVVAKKEKDSKKKQARAISSSLSSDADTTDEETGLQIARGPKKDRKAKKAKKGKEVNKKKVRPTSSLNSEHSSTRQAVRVGSSFSFNVEFYKDRPNLEQQKPTYPKEESEFLQSSVIKINRPRKSDKKRDDERHKKKSQVEFKKSKKSYALKRCFCTLKLKSKKRKSNSQKSVGTMSSYQSSEVHRDRKKHEVKELLPYECEPGICIPYKCNPNVCLQIINKRLATQKRTRNKNSYTGSRRTRSTSSVTPQLNSSKAKQVQSATIPRREQAHKKEKLKTYRVQRRNIVAKPNRNMVRIGSSFSFNIDFFKDAGQQPQYIQPEAHSFSIQPKVKAKPKKESEFKQSSVMKVKAVKKVKDKQKKHKNSTETDKSIKHKKTRSQATKTDKKISYLSHLEPYECEPFTCIPGECDPYICLENIKKRNKQTKEVSLGTYPESKSTSSYISQKSKDVFSQSTPHTKGRKVLAKNIETKKKEKKYQAQELQPRGNKYKNAVSVGSAFSFNIEFSKNYSRSDNTTVNPPPMPINLKTKHKVRHQGIKINKTNIDNANTQIEVKKADKSSIVGPMLKRCFCTLNLYKKQKRDKKAVYAVNTAYIQNTVPNSLILDKSRKRIHYDKNSFFENEKYSESQQSLFSKTSDKSLYEEIAFMPSAIHINPVYACFKTRQSLEINSDLSINVELVKKSSRSKIYISKTQLLEEILIQKYKKYMKLKDSYDAYQTDTDKKTGFSDYLNKCFCAMNMQIENNPKRKLKPYECEPGVCIPGQCNPYDCQKLILKRLQKAYSKSSATDTGSQSITSSQTQRTPTHSHLTNATFKPDHKEKHARMVRRPDGDQKQMVRVGSSFSFDVEFFKKHSYSTDTSKQYDIEPERKSTVKLTKRSKVKQPSIKTKERKVVTKYDTHDSESQSDRQKVKDKTSHTIQKMQRCFCTLKLQKKGKLKPKVKSIAKSNKVPTDTSQEETISVKTVNRGQNTKQAKPFKITRDLLPYECEPGICTPGECNPYECLALINKRTLQEKGTDSPVSKKKAASNTMDVKIKRKSRAVFVQPKRQPVIHSEKPKEYIKSPQQKTRQAVRIGSSFSFNIDFYKTNLSPNIIERTIKTERSRTSQRTKKEPDKISVKTKKEPDKISVKTKKEPKQVETPKPKSIQSKVSQTKKEPHVTKSTAVEPFLKRCFCTLQLRNKEKRASKEKKRKDVIKPEYKSVMTMTKSKKPSSEKRRTHKLETHELLPYECEPSFCTPGECDPLVCLERIKKRNVKSLGTEVISKKTKDIGSTATLKTNKHKKIQSQRIDVESKPIVEYKRPTPKIEKRSAQKQMVRIGSNFSFNVEFFKDSGANHRKPAHFDDYEKPTKKITEQTVPKMPKKQKIIQEKKSVSSNLSQTQKKTKSTKSGGLINLKRCFCTLALRNQSKVITKKQSRENTSNKLQIEGKKSKSQKQMEEKITLNKLQSESKKSKRSKSKKQIGESKTQNKLQTEDKKSKSKKQIADKETQNNLQVLDKKSKSKRQSSSKKVNIIEQSKKLKSKNKDQKVSAKGSSSSIYNNAQTAKSSVSIVSTFFRKCLCVLKLNTKKQSEIKPVVNFQIKPQKLRSLKLEPYECEPGICTPGECDPYECEKLIKKRLLRENATETKEIKFNTKSSLTPASKSYKSRHVKSKPIEPSPIKEVPIKVPKKSIPTISSDHDTSNKQSVRIGSSFSFDVEFFKHGSSEQVDSSEARITKAKDIDTKSNVKKRQKKEHKRKSTKQQSKHSVGKYDASQSTNVKTQPSSTITDPLLKRCFCTLQLHKSAARIKSSHKGKKKPLQTPMQNKMTSTKKATTVSYMSTSPQENPPFMCKPNKCNPKECDEKLRKIKINNRKDMRTSHKSVTTKQMATKSKKIQTQVVDNISKKSKNDPRGIVEVPRFNNFLNKDHKQAVRYGSNFSFNIEFYREVLPPLSIPMTNDTKTDLKDTEICDPLKCLSKVNKNRPSLKPKSIRNMQSQAQGKKTLSKRSMTVNKIKQCFCTLKLQKSKSECKAMFPQKIEVRRVEIQRNNKKPSKKTNTETKNVSTKIDNKLIKPNTTHTPQNNTDKMTTILPYRPTKFNKNPSKTLIIDDKQSNKKGQIKKPSLNVTDYRKRLTRKKSLNVIHCTKPSCVEKSDSPTFKQYLCRCVDNVFCPTDKTKVPEKLTNKMTTPGIKLKVFPKGNLFNKWNNKVNRLPDDIKTSYSERQPKRIHELSKLKTSKSVKLSKNDKNSEDCLCKQLKNTNFTIKDLFKIKHDCLCKESLKLSKKEKDCLCPRTSGAGDYKLLSEALAMLKKCHSQIMSLEDEEPYVCPKCSEMHKTSKDKKKLKVDFKDISIKSEQSRTKESTKKSNKPEKKKIKPKKISKNVCQSCAKPIDEKCQYCKVCFKSESIIKTYINVMKQQFRKLPIKRWIDKFQGTNIVKKDTKPLFDILLESDSYSIINKEEVTQKVSDLHNKQVSKTNAKASKKTKAAKHGKSCQCCICLGKKRSPQKQVVHKKGAKNKVKLGKCTCGSGVCAQNLLEMKRSRKASEKETQYKPCVCGSTICHKETKFMRDISKNPHKVTCTCKEIMTERKKKAKVKADKAYKKRRESLDKEEAMEDLARKKYRAKENKRLNKSVKKNASDAMLVADSVVDVARFGMTGIVDIIRAIFRSVRDPKHTAKRLRSVRDNPSLIGTSLQNAISETGMSSTAKRIKTRVESMESLKSATQYLEQYAVANYLLHANDPKKRLNPRKPPRRKERIDFHCNLFMSSLRRRPFLWIYDRWPWFYPHCLTFLNIWRQFADVLLFLLAVVVWSPCIFAMEMCRAVMCCTLCTG